MTEPLIPKHGGCRTLKSFQVSEVIYDLTVRFCDRWIRPGSRTHDQMVQAARSGRQSIAEGSQYSATSKKMELKLTQVARGSLEELKLDCEDYLRQNRLHPVHAVHSVHSRLPRDRGERRAGPDRRGHGSAGPPGRVAGPPVHRRRRLHRAALPRPLRTTKERFSGN